MGVIQTPITFAEDWDVTLCDCTAETESYLKPLDVTGGGAYRGYDATGRLLKIQTDGSGVRVRCAAGSAPGHTGELEELLRDFLGRVGELTNLGCDLPGPVACDRYKVETPDGFRAALFGVCDDLWRPVRGQGLRCGGR